MSAQIFFWIFIMFRFLILFLVSFQFAFANHHEENNSSEMIVTELPTNYEEFVDIIGLLKADEIINIIGEPAKKIEIKMKSTNDVIASTWYYHNLNTDAEGRYFPTTELDIVDGYVESVVFMNEVNESTDLEGNRYVVPKSDKLI